MCPPHAAMSRAEKTIALLLLCIVGLSATSCSGPSHARGRPSRVADARHTTSPSTSAASGSLGADIYAHTHAGDLAPAVTGVPSRVYVPNSGDGTVDVIDPTTFAIIDHFDTGRLPQHVSPSWDLRTLYVDNDQGNSLTPIDPRTGRPGTPIPVADPYNLYFTPDGTRAIVVAERLHRLDFRDPKTWKLVKSVAVPYAGVDHADFSADGTTMVVSCEFSGWLVRIDLASM